MISHYQAGGLYISAHRCPGPSWPCLGTFPRAQGPGEPQGASAGCGTCGKEPGEGRREQNRGSLSGGWLRCPKPSQQKRKCVWAGAADPWQQEGVTEGCAGSIPLLPKSLTLLKGLLTWGEMCFTAGLCPSRAWQGLLPLCTAVPSRGEGEGQAAGGAGITRQAQRLPPAPRQLYPL